MVSENELLKKLAVEEKRAMDRLKMIKAKQKKLAEVQVQKNKIKALNKKIARAKAQGKKPLLTTAEKERLKKGAKKALKGAGFLTDVIAFGYSAAKKKSAKKQRRY